MPKDNNFDAPGCVAASALVLSPGPLMGAVGSYYFGFVGFLVGGTLGIVLSLGMVFAALEESNRR